MKLLAHISDGWRSGLKTIGLLLCMQPLAAVPVLAQQTIQKAQSDLPQLLSDAGSALGKPDLDLARQILQHALRIAPDSVQANLMMATVEMQSGHIDAAISRFASAERIAPKSFAAHYGRAMALLRDHRNEEAVRELRTAVRLQPGQTDAVYNLGVVLIETGKPEEAMGWLRRAQEIGPDRPDLSYNLIRAELAAKHPEQAVNDAELSARRFGDDSQWRLSIGDLFLRYRQPEEAIRLLSSVTEPQGPFRRSLAVAYLQAGKPEQVTQLLSPAAEPEDHFLLARAALMQGDLVQALQHSELSVQAGASETRYLLLNAQLNQRVGRHEAALQSLTRLVASDAHNADAFYLQGVSQFFLGNFEEARKALDTCIREKTPEARVLFLYAMTYESQSQWDQEITWLRRAILAEPLNARSHTHVAFALSRRKRLEDARQEFREAIRLNPRFALAHFQLGKLLAEDGELAQAERELKSALEIQPDLGPALYALSRVFMAEGKKQESADSMKQFVAMKAQQSAEQATLAADVRQMLEEH